MCGICGVMDLGGAPVSRDLIGRMTTAIRHRGPDGDGYHVAGPLGLGHRRLSIIDLTGGAQPLTNEDDTLYLIFNGEIYNFVELRAELEEKGHRFKTRTDSEVILHGYEEWGVDCLARFNGIFAFALWDQNRKRLFLARDHLGVKPLYYVRLGQRLLFASEIKALIADPSCPREVDVQALDQLLTLRYVLSPDTLFRGVRKLPPAHLMLVSSAGIEIRRYWNWKPQIRRDCEEARLVEEYRHLVEDAVRLQMRSDVPVGLWLSSGIDSAVLLALMTQFAGKAIHTFTIGFEDGEESNETAAARALAERFGARHTEMIVGPSDYEEYFERHLGDLEEPLASETAAAFYFVSLIAGRQVKVALTGQGADELWAGYPRHLGAKLSAVYSRMPRFITESGLKAFLEKRTRNDKLRRGLRSLAEPDVASRFIKIYSLYTPEMKARLFRPWVKEQVDNGSGIRASLLRLQSDVDGMDPLTQMVYIDTRANLPDDLLMVADKTAMANSLEARVPFLDTRIVQFAESLPPRFKLRGPRAKYLHKKALEKWLPKKLVHQKKKGFENPINQWLRGRMQGFLRDRLLSESARMKEYFDYSYVREIIRKHEQGEGNYMRHIFVLILLELWHEQFMA